MKKYDVIIIGFGKGGKTLAGALASAGKTVAIAERSEKMYGGTCINVGCIPSKSLVHSSRYSIKAGGTFEEKQARYQQAVEEKNRLTAMLRKKNYDKLNTHPNITVYTGTASFIGKNQVAVQMGDTTETLEADQLFINTGARPFIPPIPGLKESKFAYISEQLLSLETLPKRLVIIGGGYIGMEFASIYHDFGAQVTVIQDLPDFLPREDEEIAQTVLESLEKRGIQILRAAKINSVKDDTDHAVLTVEHNGTKKEIPAESILVATGRRPNTEGLNLASAGIELTDRGAVKTDQHLRTTNESVWAMGDIVGGLQFTYISLDDFRIVKSQVLGNGERTTENRGAVPYSVFLSPAFSRVGLSEKEAKEQGYSIKIARLAASAIPKAQVLQQTDGLLKVIINADTNEILGAHFFCEESYEMINLIKLSMDAKLSYTVLRDSIYTHPTMSEALNDLFAAVE